MSQGGRRTETFKVDEYNVTQDFCYSLYVVGFFFIGFSHTKFFHEKHEIPVFFLTDHECSMIDKKRLYRFWKLHQSFFFNFVCLGPNYDPNQTF